MFWMKQQSCSTYKQYLFNNIDFRSSTSFKDLLYKRFCFLSWLLPDYEINILKRLQQIKETHQHRFIVFQSFETMGSKAMKKEPKLYQLYEQFINLQKSKTQKRLTIRYKLLHQSQQQLCQTFQKCTNLIQDKEFDFDIIFIEIQETKDLQIQIIVFNEKLFQKLFPHQKIAYQQKKYLKPIFFQKSVKNGFMNEKDIQYPFQQSYQSRCFQPKGYHLSLAFQGGGSKGVSYVGVYSQIKLLQQRIYKESHQTIKIQIKSLIGSSAGGILALAISAGICQKQVNFVCKMLDTLVDDILVQTQNQGNSINQDPTSFNANNSDQIEKDYFKNEQNNIKNVLNNLGLIQSDLSTVLIQILKDPEVQDNIVNVIQAFNPSLAALLTYKKQNTQKQRTTCCSEQKQIKQLRKVNYYGLLYAGLMSGSAMQNIIAFILVLYMKQLISNDKVDDNQIKINKLTVFIQQWNIKCQQPNWHLSVNTLNKDAENVIGEYQTFNKNKKNLKKSGQKIRKSQMKYGSMPLMQFAKTITLKQYYELIGIQFTCTSVDLNDKILRFFNHKTTPQLPICKAVLMTGSFPVAFRSLKWQKQWGAYYIHYQGTLRQINLQNHLFMDGGLLANFPLMFIDNEQFRPMYFSHAKTEETIMTGFGLHQLQEFPQKQNNQQLTQAVNALKQKIMQKIPCKLYLTFLNCCKKNQFLEEGPIKILQYLLSLVIALQQSDRNLNMECFKHDIVQTEVLQNQVIRVKDYKTAMTDFINELNQFYKQISEHFNKSIKQIIDQQFDVLIKIAEQPGFNYQGLQFIQSQISNNLNCLFRNIYPSFIKYKDGQDFKIQTISKYLTSFKEELQLNQPSELDVQNSMVNAVELARNIRKITKQNDIIIKKNARATKNKKIKEQMFANPEQTQKIVLYKNRLTPFCHKLYKKVNQIRKTKLYNMTVNIFIEQKARKQQQKIKQKTENILRRKIDQYIRNFYLQKKQGPFDMLIHIILQAYFSSHYYYPNYFDMIENILSQLNKQNITLYPHHWKKIEINIISCTDYHSMFGVFYALGYPINTIKKNMQQITKTFIANPKIEEEFASEKWMKTSVQKMRAFLIEEWASQFDLFRHYQLEDKKYQKGENNHSAGDLYANKPLQMQQMEINAIHRYKISEEQFHQKLQELLNYVIGSFKQLSKLKKSQRRQRISQLLSLGSQKSKNQTKSNRGKRLMRTILQYTSELLIIISQKIILSASYTHIPENQYSMEALFKGMVIGQFIRSIKFKLFIFKTLKDAGLNSDITLLGFYQSSRRKVLLNFNCVKTFEERFSLINKTTKPNMPLWTAIMSATSLPYLCKQTKTRRQWQIRNDYKDFDVRQAYIYFKEEQYNDTNSTNTGYLSGKFISPLPIILMTNHFVIDYKLLSERKPNQQIIELAFSFQMNKTNQQIQINQQKQNISNKIYQQSRNVLSSITTSLKTRNFIGCCGLLSLFCEYNCCYCCSCQGVLTYFQDMLTRFEILKMLLVRINSHDNLILHLYFNELIKLPIRIGTLDFHKINDSETYQDTIRQAKYVVRQRFQKIQIDSANPNKLSSRGYYPHSFIQVYLVQYEQKRHLTQVINNNQNDVTKFCRIKFVSYSKWRNIKSKYRISYKFAETTQQNNLLNKDFVDIRPSTNGFYELQIKYTYCDLSLKIKSKSHHFRLAGQNLSKQHGKRAIFDLQYKKQYHSQYLIGQWKGLQNQDDIEEPLPKIFISTIKQIQCTDNQCQICQCDLYSIIDQKIRGKCGNCLEANSILAMKCKSGPCDKFYCVKCKKDQFIKKLLDQNSNQIVRKFCPIDNEPFKYTTFQPNINEIHFCYLCNQVYYKLWVTKCGIRVCDNCMLGISQEN